MICMEFKIWGIAYHGAVIRPDSIGNPFLTSVYDVVFSIFGFYSCGCEVCYITSGTGFGLGGISCQLFDEYSLNGTYDGNTVSLLSQ